MRPTLYSTTHYSAFSSCNRNGMCECILIKSSCLCNNCFGGGRQFPNLESAHDRYLNPVNYLVWTENFTLEI